MNIHAAIAKVSVNRRNSLIQVSLMLWATSQLGKCEAKVAVNKLRVNASAKVGSNSQIKQSKAIVSASWHGCFNYWTRHLYQPALRLTQIWNSQAVESLILC